MQLASHNELVLFVYVVLVFYLHVGEDEGVDGLALGEGDADLGFGVGGVYGLAARAAAPHEVRFYLVLLQRHVFVGFVLGCGE